MEIRHRIQNARVGAQRLEQKILCAQREKPFCNGDVHFSGRQCLGVRCRAEVGKHRRAALLRRLFCQLPPCFGQLFPARKPSRRHPRQAEGVGLEGVRARGQIFPVDGLHPRRVGAVGLLTLLPGLRLIIGTHAAVKQQRLAFEMFPDVDHVGGSFVS